MAATGSTTETVTILFTDLVNSTEISGALGEEEADAHRRLHFRLLREAIGDYRGHEVKSLGDGVMVVFPSAADAVFSAVAMQTAARTHNATAGVACLDIRIGIHTGEPIREDGDYFGTPVVIASRLTSRAQGGQILISDIARRVVGPRAGLQFHDYGRLSLKGLTEPVPAAEVDWRASRLPRAAASLRITSPAHGRLPFAWRRPLGRRRLAVAVSAIAATTAIVLALVFTGGGPEEGIGLAAGDDTARVLEGLHYRQELVYPNGTFIMGDSEESAEGVRVSAVWSTPDEPAMIFAFYLGAFGDLGFESEAQRVSTVTLESLTVGQGSDAALVIVEPGRGLDGENRITVAFTLR